MRLGGVMWASAVDQLLKKIPDLEDSLIKECETGGIARAKARFIEKLFSLVMKQELLVWVEQETYLKKSLALNDLVI